MDHAAGRPGPAGAGAGARAPAAARSPPGATGPALGGVQAWLRGVSVTSWGDVLRAGDVVHGYRLLEDFRVVGAGLSEWTFADRDGRTYFIKRFLAPTYPDDDAPGSAKTKARKRARCAAFEAHHR